MITNRRPLFHLASLSTALAAPHLQARASISSIVAFGDELSDNGNGSYAHGVTGDPATVYGYGTWTNGPVAVSYLASSLGVPLVADYAFGGCCGAASSGATLDSSYTEPDAGAPSLQDQVANYSAAVRKGVFRPSSSLGFIWVGQNDLSKHTDAFWLGDPHNQEFANSLSTYTVTAVQRLLDLGMPYVVVSNIYPKHIAPVTATYLCGGTNNDCTRTWGQVISNANSKLQKTLSASFGKKVIYYDSFNFISYLAGNASSLGFTQPLTKFCDGQGDASWNQCMVTETSSSGNTKIIGWNTFFWMNFVQPTTRVHQLIGQDMAKTVKKALGL
ncbi:hypothetical protein LTS08_001444 [Lithohypha guttulata]|nr:hypothetical protein LTS08_001444 [Lithohypha guttulata]